MPIVKIRFTATSFDIFSFYLKGQNGRTRCFCVVNQCFIDADTDSASLAVRVHPILQKSRTEQIDLN